MVQPSISDKWTIICNACGMISDKAYTPRDIGKRRPNQQRGILPEGYQWRIVALAVGTGLTVECKECRQ